jgi:hypothetical protein
MKGWGAPLSKDEVSIIASLEQAAMLNPKP